MGCGKMGRSMAKAGYVGEAGSMAAAAEACAGPAAPPVAAQAESAAALTAVHGAAGHDAMHGAAGDDDEVEWPSAAVGPACPRGSRCKGDGQLSVVHAERVALGSEGARCGKCASGLERGASASVCLPCGIVACMDCSCWPEGRTASPNLKPKSKPKPNPEPKPKPKPNPKPDPHPNPIPAQVVPRTR